MIRSTPANRIDMNHSSFHPDILRRIPPHWNIIESGPRYLRIRHDNVELILDKKRIRSGETDIKSLICKEIITDSTPNPRTFDPLSQRIHDALTYLIRSLNLLPTKLIYTTEDAISPRVKSIKKHLHMLFRMSEDAIQETESHLMSWRERLSAALSRHSDALNSFPRRLTNTTHNALTSRNESIGERRDTLLDATNKAIAARTNSLDETRALMTSTWKNAEDIFVGVVDQHESYVSHTPSHDHKDHELISEWSKGVSLMRHEDNAEKEDRLLSARLAEKAVLNYLRKIGHKDVRDISIMQIYRPPNRDWRSHDIVVDGDYWDVKNIRTKRADRFGEHFVQDHKQSPSGEPVGWIAVVTFTQESIQQNDDSQAEIDSQKECLVIGQLDQAGPRTIIQMIRQAADAMGCTNLCIEEDRWYGSLPVWIFEYSNEHYDLLQSMSWGEIARIWRKVSTTFDVPVPKWISMLEATRQDTWGSNNDHEQNHSVLWSWLRSDGIRRSRIFWGILVYVLSKKGGVHPDEFEALEKMLFVGNQATLPMGLYDPRKCVMALLQALRTLCEKNADVLMEATNFRLAGNGILRASFSDGLEKTILAYCGECGRSPLYLGGCIECPCDKKWLCCDDCGHCGYRECPGHEFSDRDSAWVEFQRRPQWRLQGNWLRPPKVRDDDMADFLQYYEGYDPYH